MDKPSFTFDCSTAVRLAIEERIQTIVIVRKPYTIGGFALELSVSYTFSGGNPRDHVTDSSYGRQRKTHRVRWPTLRSSAGAIVNRV